MLFDGALGFIILAAVHWLSEFSLISVENRVSVAILKEQDFIDQCVVTSLDPNELLAAKAIEPDLIVGHIVTAAVGDVSRLEVDFLSLNRLPEPEHGASQSSDDGPMSGRWKRCSCLDCQ